MKALIFDEPGDPSAVLRLAQISEPDLAPSGVVIKVEARPIQPADLAFVRGQYRIRPQSPQVAGLEGAGTIVLTSDPSVWPLGTRVAFRWPGSWAEKVAVPFERLIRLPDDVEMATGCQAALNPLTAYALLKVSEAQKGEIIVVSAATSTVANVLGVLARTKGVRTIGLVRGNASEARLRTSTETVISVDDPDYVIALTRLAEEGPPCAFVDSVGGPIVNDLMPLLRQGGKVISYGVQDKRPASVGNAAMIYANLTWIGFGIDYWLAANKLAASAFFDDALWPLLRMGSLTLPVAQTFQMGDFQPALLKLSQPHMSGKVVLI